MSLSNPVSPWYQYQGYTQVGYKRENDTNQDSIFVKELGPNKDILLSIISDGTVSVEGKATPADMVIQIISDFVTRQLEENQDLFFKDTSFILKMAILMANVYMGGLKTANENLWGGYSASVTCCIIYPSNDAKGNPCNYLHFAHCGSTRLYLLYDAKLHPLTADHTKAYEKYAAGEISREDIAVQVDGKDLTSQVGMIQYPKIQTGSSIMYPHDLVLLTTDGIHYSIKEDAIAKIILGNNSFKMAVESLINGAIDIMKWEDDVSCILIAESL